MKYEVIIYWSEEDSAFIAEAPELPGCMADGETYQEAPVCFRLLLQSKSVSRPDVGWQDSDCKGPESKECALAERVGAVLSGRI